MPPGGIAVSLVAVMQKCPKEDPVTRGSGQKPRMTAGRAKVPTASVAWTSAELDALMERAPAAEVARGSDEPRSRPRSAKRTATWRAGRKMASVIGLINPVL